MNEPTPLASSAQKRDRDHLKLLAVFHFIGAGLGLLGILFLVGHYIMMHEIFTNPKIF